MRTLRFLLLLFLVGCSSIVSFPYRAQLYGPSRQRPPREGSVIAVRADGALLFQFDDQTEGDHGYLWVSAEDTRYRIVRGVGADDLMRRQPRPIFQEGPRQ